MYGTAGVSYAGGSTNVSMDVTFGHDGTPGLVITNGALVSLDVIVNAISSQQGDDHRQGPGVQLHDRHPYVRPVRHGRRELRGRRHQHQRGRHLWPRRRPGNLDRQRRAGLAGHDRQRQFQVSEVTITATNLEFSYTAATNTFAMYGTAGVKFWSGEVIVDMSVTFGHTNADGTQTPGLLVQNGSLALLDVTVDGYFMVDFVAIYANELDFSYTAATDTFTLAGTAGVGIFGLANLSVTFGHNGLPGMVVSGGHLKSLDMTVNGTFDVVLVDFRATWS